MAKESSSRVEIIESDVVDVLSIFAKKAFDAGTTEPGSYVSVLLFR